MKQKGYFSVYSGGIFEVGGGCGEQGFCGEVFFLGGGVCGDFKCS